MYLIIKNNMVALSPSSREGNISSSGKLTHVNVFIGNTLASAIRLNGYFRLETVSGRPVQGTSSEPRG